ncbi:MAG: hypothetical protein JNJ94_16220 [Chlorobi bacterium]|nr:hypothetical protein [Chlorobiota bacterium]
MDTIVGVKYMDISCADDEHCIASCDSAWWTSSIRKTTDGGKTWKNVLQERLIFEPGAPDLRRFFSIAHPTPMLLLTICDSGIGFRSVDGGETWNEFRLPMRIGSNYKIQMRDATHGFIAGPYQQLYRTVDGAETWQAVPLPDSLGNYNIAKVIDLPPDTLIISIVKSAPRKIILIKSFDNGATWSYHEPPELLACPKISFPDAQYGFAVGLKFLNEAVSDDALDMFTYSTDGGATWVPPIGEWRNKAMGLSEVQFLDRLHGIAVGPGGKILRTADGGKQWNIERTPLDTHYICNISALEYPSLRTGYVGVVNFQMLRWFPTSSGSNNDVAFHPHAMTITPNLISGNSPSSVTAIIDNPGNVRIEIINSAGERLWSRDYPGTQLGEFHQSIQPELPSGTYFVRLLSADKIIGNSVLTVLR